MLVGYQFFCLLRCTEWNHIICMALVLFCNYYTLFKLLRDRIILSKTYKDDELFKLLRDRIILSKTYKDDDNGQ